MTSRPGILDWANASLSDTLSIRITRDAPRTWQYTQQREHHAARHVPSYHHDRALLSMMYGCTAHTSAVRLNEKHMSTE